MAALVPLPHVHLVRHGGCLAPQSHLRGSIIPTPRQEGVDEDDASTEAPRWRWARVLTRVCAIDMATWPLCRQGSLRIIAADPPPVAPARAPDSAVVKRAFKIPIRIRYTHGSLDDKKLLHAVRADHTTVTGFARARDLSILRPKARAV